MRIAVCFGGVIFAAGLWLPPVVATGQEYTPVPDSSLGEYETEATESRGGWVYVGRKGSFHFDTAQTVDRSDSRGVFKTVSWNGTRYWTNSFVKMRVADPHFWHYRMVGYSYEVAVAKYPSWCGRYAIWTRNPAYSRLWSLYDHATRGRPRGNGN